MVAAAATLWLMFSVWMTAPYLGVPDRLVRTAAILMVSELVCLLAWSYGVERCVRVACAPLAQAAGVAARTDIPILALVLVVVTGVVVRRAALDGVTRAGRAGRTSPPSPAPRSAEPPRG